MASHELVYLLDTQPLTARDNRRVLLDIGTTYQLDEVQELGDGTVSGVINHDSCGYPLPEHRFITCPVSSLVSRLRLKTITPSRFYAYPVRGLLATNFVDTNIVDHPLQSASRFALGSGIVGNYCSNWHLARALAVNSEPYTVFCAQPFIVQDKAHCQSITNASIQTNAYLEHFLAELQFNEYSSSAIRKDLHVGHLCQLWNIVFGRSKEAHHVTEKALRKVFARYLLDYWSVQSFLDEDSNNVLRPLPINYLMEYLGYDSLLSNDSYSNGWERGSVHYNLAFAESYVAGRKYY